MLKLIENEESRKFYCLLITHLQLATHAIHSLQSIQRETIYFFFWRMKLVSYPLYIIRVGVVMVGKGVKIKKDEKRKEKKESALNELGGVLRQIVQQDQLELLPPTTYQLRFHSLAHKTKQNGQSRQRHRESQRLRAKGTEL